MVSLIAPIAVGYDGSPASRSALRWATKEAVRRHAALRIVEIFEFVLTHRPLPGSIVPLAGMRTAREKDLAAAAQSIRLQHPALEVQTRLVEGSAASALLEETEQAQLLVVGSRGHGGWTNLLVGSVAVQVSMHAQCPVLVMPPVIRPRVHGQPIIVVGVDGSKGSGLAVDFAFEQADVRGGKVLAVHAWTSPVAASRDGAGALLFDQVKVDEAGHRLVVEALAEAAITHPTVEHEVKLVSGQPARALLTAADAADLIVVGSRGLGGFAGLLLGSVSQSVLHHAPCPVAILH